MYPRARNTLTCSSFPQSKEEQQTLINTPLTISIVQKHAVNSQVTQKEYELSYRFQLKTPEHTQRLFQRDTPGKLKQQVDTGLAEETTPLTMIDNDLLHPAET